MNTFKVGDKVFWKDLVTKELRYGTLVELTYTIEESLIEKGELEMDNLPIDTTPVKRWDWTVEENNGKRYSLPETCLGKKLNEPTR